MHDSGSRKAENRVGNIYILNMKNNRLSLEAFKAKANKTSETEILNKIQGGAYPECHTEDDQRRKAIIQHNNKILHQQYGNN